MSHAERMSKVPEGGAEVVPLRSEAPGIDDTLKQVRELADAHQFGKAREMLARALANWGDRADLLLRLAEVEKDSGHFEQAMSYFGRAVALDPADPVLVSAYADFLAGSGMPRQALEVLSQIPDAMAKNPRMRAVAGSIHLGARWYGLACDAYGDPRDLPPESRGARRRCWLRSGGPLKFVRRRVRRFDEDARRHWYSWSAELSSLDDLARLKGFAAAKLKGEIDLYMRARASTWVHLEAAEGWLRRRLPYVIAGVAWIAAFIAQELFWHQAGAAAAAVVATVTTGGALVLRRPAIKFANAARSLSDVAMRGAFAAAITVGGGLTLIIAVAAPPAWPGVLGMILLGTAAIVTVGAAILNAAIFLTIIRLRDLRRTWPRALILWMLTDLLSEVSLPDMRNDFDQRAAWVRDLERTAKLMERALPGVIPWRDLQTTQWASERARGAASALRRMKRWIAAPTAGSWDRLIVALRQELGALASGDLGALRWAPPPPPEAAWQRVLRATLATIRVLIVTVVPIAAVAVLQVALKVTSHYITIAWVASISWAVIYLLVTIDPTVPGKIELARGIFGAISTPKQLSGPRE